MTAIKTQHAGAGSWGSRGANGGGGLGDRLKVPVVSFHGREAARLPDPPRLELNFPGTPPRASSRAVRVPGLPSPLAQPAPLALPSQDCSPGVPRGPQAPGTQPGSQQVFGGPDSPGCSCWCPRCANPGPCWVPGHCSGAPTRPRLRGPAGVLHAVDISHTHSRCHQPLLR